MSDVFTVEALCQTCSQWTLLLPWTQAPSLSSSPHVSDVCVFGRVWPPSMLSHALLSITGLWRCGSTSLPFFSTCFFPTFWLTVISLCLPGCAPPPVSLSLLRGFLGLSVSPSLSVCRSRGAGWCLSLSSCSLFPPSAYKEREMKKDGCQRGNRAAMNLNGNVFSLKSRFRIVWRGGTESSVWKNRIILIIMQNKTFNIVMLSLLL